MKAKLKDGAHLYSWRPAKNPFKVLWDWRIAENGRVVATSHRQGYEHQDEALLKLRRAMDGTYGRRFSGHIWVNGERVGTF